MNKVHYLHVRYLTYGMRKNKAGLPAEILRGITFAYTLDDDDNITRYAYAKCSINDNFTRKQGRVIAVNRLLMTPVTTLKATWEEFVERCVEGQIVNFH